MDTNIVVVEKAAINRAGALFVEAFGHSPALLVSDGAALGIGGFALIQSLEQQGIEVRQCSFATSENLGVHEFTIRRVRRALAEDASIAVVLGSGTLNDIAKRASYEADRPYMVVATAPSVDGYTTPGVRITNKDKQLNLACNGPTVVVGDTDILSAAPQQMISSGFGVCMSSYTAGADWIIADHLGLQAMRKDIWKMVQLPLRKVYASSKGVAHRSERAIGQLFEALAARGIAMQIVEGRYPARGAEHVLAQQWSSLNVEYGLKVAVATLSMSFLYEMLPRMDFSSLMQRPIENWHEREQVIKQSFPDEEVLQQAKERFLHSEGLMHRRQAILIALPHILRRCTVHLPPYRELRAAMAEVGCPTSYEELGLTKEEFVQTLREAQMVSSGYSLLDLLYEAGFLEEALAQF